MIYGYIIEFPMNEDADKETPGPSIEVTSSSEWEPSLHVYKYETWNQRFLHIATMGDSAHRSQITLKDITKKSSRFFFRLVHKTGSSVDDLPWFSSNNVLNYHGPQNVYEPSNPIYRPMIIKIFGDDGNDDDPSDVTVHLSYGGSGWAVIKAITEKLEEGFLVPPSELNIKV